MSAPFQPEIGSKQGSEEARLAELKVAQDLLALQLKDNYKSQEHVELLGFELVALHATVEEKQTLINKLNNILISKEETIVQLKQKIEDHLKEINHLRTFENKNEILSDQMKKHLNEMEIMSIELRMLKESKEDKSQYEESKIMKIAEIDIILTSKLSNAEMSLAKSTQQNIEKDAMISDLQHQLIKLSQTLKLNEEIQFEKLARIKQKEYTNLDRLDRISQAYYNTLDEKELLNSTISIHNTRNQVIETQLVDSLSTIDHNMELFENVVDTIETKNQLLSHNEMNLIKENEHLQVQLALMKQTLDKYIAKQVKKNSVTPFENSIVTYTEQQQQQQRNNGDLRVGEQNMGESSFLSDGSTISYPHTSSKKMNKSNNDGRAILDNSQYMSYSTVNNTISKHQDAFTKTINNTNSNSGSSTVGHKSNRLQLSATAPHNLQPSHILHTNNKSNNKTNTKLKINNTAKSTTSTNTNRPKTTLEQSYLSHPSEFSITVQDFSKFSNSTEQNTPYKMNKNETKLNKLHSPVSKYMNKSALSPINKSMDILPTIMNKQLKPHKYSYNEMQLNYNTTISSDAAHGCALCNSNIMKTNLLSRYLDVLVSIHSGSSTNKTNTVDSSSSDSVVLSHCELNDLDIDMVISSLRSTGMSLARLSYIHLQHNKLTNIALMKLIVWLLALPSKDTLRKEPLVIDLQHNQITTEGITDAVTQLKQTHRQEYALIVAEKDEQSDINSILIYGAAQSNSSSSSSTSANTLPSISRSPRPASQPSINANNSNTQRKNILIIQINLQHQNTSYDFNQVLNNHSVSITAPQTGMFDVLSTKEEVDREVYPRDRIMVDDPFYALTH